MTEKNVGKSSEWATALEIYRAAKLAHEQHMSDVYQPASRAMDLEFLDEPQPVLDYIDDQGRPALLSPDDAFDPARMVIQAEAEAGPWQAIRALREGSARHRALRNLAAATVRSKRLKILLMRKHHIHEIERQGDELADIYQDRLDGLFETPAPDLDALLTKLEIGMTERFEHEDDIAISIAHIINDVRKLAKRY